MVAADAAQMRQVVLNLLRNALEAVQRERGGKVEARVDQVDGTTRVRVRNTTGLIPPENMQRLFEPFFTTRPGGTGLGLAVSHSIVQAHGGTIDVTSAPESGTTFTVVLPARREEGTSANPDRR